MTLCFYRGNIKNEDLFTYIENKEKFAIEKNFKKKDFKEAMDQIEAALHGEDSAPINVSTISYFLYHRNSFCFVRISNGIMVIYIK